MYGGKEILLNMVRPCWMDVIPSMALDMYGSPYLTILYLLMDERRNERV